MGRWGESDGWDGVLYAHVVMPCHLLLVGITTFFLKSPRENPCHSWQCYHVIHNNLKLPLPIFCSSPSSPPFCIPTPAYLGSYACSSTSPAALILIQGLHLSLTQPCTSCYLLPHRHLSAFLSKMTAVAVTAATNILFVKVVRHIASHPQPSPRALMTIRCRPTANGL